MNVLIVLAHPEPTSFNASLAEVAKDSFESRGDIVRLCDLNANGFDPVEHARHFARRKDPVQFDAQTEQRFSSEQRSLPKDVRREIDNLLWADFVLLQFPLWWFGAPAILKGWMDRVFVYGTLYTGKRCFDAGFCLGKRLRLSVTTGSSAAACSHNGREGDSKLVLWPINYAFRYLGFTVLESALIHGVRRGHSEHEEALHRRRLEAALQEHRKWIGALDEVPVVQFNRDSDWDELGQLRADAPMYSPFIRHRPDGWFA
jgi:NAD(P)H dehydrogenase (quinone)